MSIHEECGVFGIYSPNVTDVAVDTYYALYALQHRGQESAGIVVNNDGLFNVKKDEGLVGKIFTPEILNNLGEGSMAIGHVRYATPAEKAVINAQPIVVNHFKGHLAIANNGSLVNYNELRHELELTGSIFQMLSDSEVIAYSIIKERLTEGTIEGAVNKAMYKLKGAYSLVIMSPKKLIGVRDENGLRPLCYGTTADGGYAIASESCALNAIGATYVRDLEPGEIIVIDSNGIRSIKDHCKKVPKKICIFEYVYFARPDSVIEGISVHHARVKAGEFLAEDSPVDADVVIGVPDSGLDAAIGYSKKSGIPYEMGFLKNKYIGRTFIAPSQKMREKSVKIKLNVISDVVKDKRVVMVDDSIVRGTTCAKLVKLIKDAGAKEVHVRLSSPPFINPCYYGTDIDSRDKLIACQMTIDEIRDFIGADSLGYLRVERLADMVNTKLGEGYCDGCFTNVYPTEIPESTLKNKFGQGLSQKNGGKK